MALEDLTGTKYIDDLVATNPTATDDVSEGDDHIRGIKNVLKVTLPNVTGAITPTHTELNYVDGVTSAIQTQIDNTVTVANAALPKSGGAMTGAITTNSTFDGVDIATRDGVLTSTTTTANAALPKAGGAMTGAITTNSTFDGRDVATDGTKLDGIEASADVTDATNVAAAGALMKSGGTLTGDLNFGDNVDANFGAGTDLKIYHGGSDSYIDETGTGNLKIRSSGVAVQLETVAGENMVVATVDGSVDLYHNGVKKLETTATGATVTGALLETAPRSGQIIQRHASNPNIGHHQTNSASWTELNTTFRVTITPQYANSSIEVDVLFMFGGNNSTNITHFRIYDVTNNAAPNIDTAGNRQGVHGSARQVDADANDVDMMFISMRTSAGNTNARTYSFQAKNESGTTLKNYFASSSNSSALSYAKPIMRVTEIAA